ncbi:ATP-binding protein [Prescottella defluvii]|uniref:tetratricopeptide repeat protein n=1 Tax=Prescottella defluvii TaxID=1323361 RepID=UPI0012E01573|nr:ATP-binding protein [Prescottella defluvii]
MSLAIEDVRMSRARLYVLIDSFEQDMRRTIESNLLDHLTERDILTEAEFTEASRRQKLDENGDHVSIIHYLDLGTCFDIMLRNKDCLPTEVVQEIRDNAPSVAKLSPIRHRVMHGRPLNSDDPIVAVSILSGFHSRAWEETVVVIGRLRRDPTWEPYFERSAVPFEKTLHNLPEVDYDETSFIGRKDESEKLFQALIRRRQNVITVTGEGGIGKTTLALDVAYRILDSDANPYEAILWVSLKTERLTAYGVEELRNAIQGIDQTIVALGRGLDNDFTGRLTDLSHALEGIECLIIIDNLESAQGDEIVHMYDVLPPSVNYLFTSRLGIGQLERRFPLPPLSAQEAKLLLRKFSKARNQRKLAGLSEKTLDKVVEQLRCSPLAIRWYVLSSEAGKVPLDTLRDQRELLDFCVKNVYDGLPQNARAVLTILRALDRSIGFDEFAILTDMSIDDLRSATQKLTQGSLVSVESESAGAVAGKLALTPTARMFVARPDHSGAFIGAVLQRERQFRASVEHNAQQKQERINPERVFPSDELDHPATFLLSRAVTMAKSGQYDRAHEQIERARSFNPEFSEVYRISGFVNTLERRYENAVSEYKMALSYATDPIVTATTNYSLANVMAKDLHDAGLALPHAKSAYQTFPCSDTSFLLGRVLIWTGNFKDGQETIENHLEETSGRHRRIVLAVLVDSWARWADREFAARRFKESFDKASVGIHSGVVAMNEGGPHSKTAESIAECAIVLFKSWQKLEEPTSNSQERAIRQVVDFVVKWSRSISPRRSSILSDRIGTAASAVGSGHRLHGELVKACSLLA